jgi:hypothetical protein
MAEAQKLEVVPANSPSIGSTQACTVEYVQRHLRMHTVSESELDGIASGNSTLNLTFFGICFGCAVSFGIVLYSGGLPQDHKSTYNMLFFASLILSGYFGFKGGKDYVGAKDKLKNLKKGQSYGETQT